MSLRGARVSDYNGKSLNSGDEHSQIFIDINHKRTDELRRWWATQKRDPLAFNSITGGLVNSLVNPIQNPCASKTDLTESKAVIDRDNFKLCDELIEEVDSLRKSFGSN